MKRWMPVVALLVVGLTFVVLARVASAQGCPPVERLRTYEPPQASQVFARDGSLVAALSPQKRVVVDLERVSPLLRDGLVAVEDRRFWDHGGIDPRGVARAVFRNLRSGSLGEGFTTLTMELVYNIFPAETGGTVDKLRRKACEVVLAGRIEREFTKREILELYLNQMYLGSGFYGVEAASQGYFDKPASEVTAAEAALLVGLLKAPEGYNPRKRPEKAIARRNVVLAVMAREGVISASAAKRAQAEPLRLAPAEITGSAPFLVAQVRREARERFGPDADILGLRIHTGLDPVVQRAATAALRAQIARVESGAMGRYPHPVPAPDERGAPDDPGSPYLQGMVVALDARTGEVRALVGGRDFGLSQYDHAFAAHRQPGSSFKPIVYAAALRQGLPITTRIETTPVVLRDRGTPIWSPDDNVPDSVAALPLRDALARSSNNAAVRVGQWAGVQRVIETARSLGIETPIPAYPSIFLGAAEVVPAELVAAYAAFGNGGWRVEPVLITRVEDAQGRVLWQPQLSRQRALDDASAFLTLSLLEDVVDRGTGRAVRNAGFWLPAAGKTGTTNGSKDAWFIGLTPDLAAGVWIGFDQPRRIIGNAGGGALAAPVWGQMMKEVYSEWPAPGPWVAPSSLLSLPVDVATGALATGNCPPDQVRIEYFLPGTEPQEYCPLHPESGAERLLERLIDGIRDIF